MRGHGHGHGGREGRWRRVDRMGRVVDDVRRWRWSGRVSSKRKDEDQDQQNDHNDRQPAKAHPQDGRPKSPLLRR